MKNLTFILFLSILLSCKEDLTRTSDLEAISDSFIKSIGGIYDDENKGLISNDSDLYVYGYFSGVADFDFSSSENKIACKDMEGDLCESENCKCMYISKVLKVADGFEYKWTYVWGDSSPFKKAVSMDRRGDDISGLVIDSEGGIIITGLYTDGIKFMDASSFTSSGIYYLRIIEDEEAKPQIDWKYNIVDQSTCHGGHIPIIYPNKMVIDSAGEKIYVTGSFHTGTKDFNFRADGVDNLSDLGEESNGFLTVFTKEGVYLKTMVFGETFFNIYASNIILSNDKVYLTMGAYRHSNGQHDTMKVFYKNNEAELKEFEIETPGHGIGIVMFNDGKGVEDFVFEKSFFKMTFTFGGDVMDIKTDSESNIVMLSRLFYVNSLTWPTTVYKNNHVYSSITKLSPDLDLIWSYDDDVTQCYKDQEIVSKTFGGAIHSSSYKNRRELCLMKSLSIAENDDIYVSGSFSSNKVFDLKNNTEVIASYEHSLDGFVAVYDKDLNFKNKLIIAGPYDDIVDGVSATTLNGSINVNFSGTFTSELLNGGASVKSSGYKEGIIDRENFFAKYNF